MSTDQIATTSTPAGRWRTLPWWVRIGVVIAVAIIGVDLLAKFVSDSTGGGNTPGGRPSSAYATQNAGLAAYTTLLTHEGHPVDITRGPLRDGTLDPATTVVVFDPDTISFDDAGILLTFVVNGGRLIIGDDNPSYFSALLQDPPEWNAPGPTHWSTVDVSLAPIHRIISTGDAYFSDLGTTDAVVSEGGTQTLVADATVGRGTIVFVADPSPFQNRLLGTADNAALGVALVGEPGRTVVFPEGVHGYGPSRGLAAIPDNWKIALLGLAIAGLVLMWARGRRLGPPEAAGRTLPPPRAAYVDAIGSTLLRTRQPDVALAGVVRRVRESVDAGGAGLSPEDIAVVSAPITEESVLALGRALSHVEQSTRKEDR